MTADQATAVLATLTGLIENEAKGTRKIVRAITNPG